MYQKPAMSALGQESESCGCCFYFTNSGEGVYIYNGEGGSRPKNLVQIGDNGAQVTPLCGTGLPATQPITFGVPVGVTGVSAAASANGAPTAGVDAHHLGVSALGHGVGTGGLPIPL